MTSIALLISLLASSQTAASSNVKFIDEGFVFPVVLQIDSTQYVWTGGVLPLANGGKPTAAMIPTGPHTVLCRNSTFGFPQPVEFMIREKDGTSVWESGVTVDAKRVELKLGQTLEIHVQKPFLSYNGQKVLLPAKGVQAVLIGARPYWFYFAGDKPAAVGEPGYLGNFPLGYEEYPNGMFFLADEAKWGIKGVAKDLAHKIYTDVQENRITPDHRGNCHWSLLTTLTPDGQVPLELKKLSEADFEKAIEVAFVGLLEHNFHRPFAADDIRYFKSRGWVPLDYPEAPQTMSFVEDLRLAKILLPKWKEIRRKQEKEEAKKAVDTQAKPAAAK